MNGFMKSGVARGLFALFVLCALAPLAVVALMSLTQVRALLLQQGENRLAAHAKNYGMGIFERLLLATDIARASASSPRVASDPHSMANRAFKSTAMVQGGQVVALTGGPLPATLDASTRERLNGGKPVLVVTPDNRFVLAVPVTGGFVVGELRPEYIWGPADELPAMTEFCIVQDSDRKPLYCSSAEARDVLSVGVIQSHAVTTWKRGEETMRTRGWWQFMRAALGAPDWAVLATQAEAYQLRAAADFQRTYALVVVLALLLVTWFTVRKSRQIVTPVARLTEHAREIANNNYSARVDLAQKDEFGELASAFNTMTRRVGQQFASLTALSEIDRLILATQDTTQVVRTVLHRMEEVVPAEQIALVLIDRDNPDYARTYYRPPQDTASMSMDRATLAREEHAALQLDAGMCRFELAGAAASPSYLAPLRSRGMAVALVQPILWRGEVCGALAMGFLDGAAALSEEEKGYVAEIGDRVAVAVSSAWRDEKLHQHAHFDQLTGLPNRLLFHDRLEREIARGQRDGAQFAVLFVDLDHFKNVNESLGHSLGDEVLREAGRRIQHSVRQSDTVSRLGGDEFTVLLTKLSHPQEAWLIGETIVSALSQEFRMGSQHCFLSASVGIASYPADGKTAEELLRSADTAMYKAKANGRSQAVFFEEQMNREAVARMTLDRDLRAAIDRGELVLHYQPQINLKTSAIVSCEALVRWMHPIHGLVLPGRFIPLAEESGFIEHIGRWALEQACAQMSEWRAQGVNLENIGVNVSPRQLRRRNLVDFIRACVNAAKLPASCIEIEITEGMLMEQGGPVEEMLHDLARAGHRISLDDFGTGFSSMARLKRLPVSTIKIDRAFVDGMREGTDSEAIVAAIVAMSHALGKIVIAEGVETEEQEAILRRVGCDEVQGFLYAPALPAAEFANLVRTRSQARLPA